MSAGHHFYEDGTLSITSHMSIGNARFLITRYWRKPGEEIDRVEVESACPECGCPEARYHSVTCGYRVISTVIHAAGGETKRRMIESVWRNYE